MTATSTVESSGRLREDKMMTTMTESKQDVLVPFAEVDLVFATEYVAQPRRESKKHAAHNEFAVKWFGARSEFLEKHTRETWRLLVQASQPFEPEIARERAEEAAREAEDAAMETPEK
jgi:hypothetical protein